MTGPTLRRFPKGVLAALLVLACIVVPILVAAVLSRAGVAISSVELAILFALSLAGATLTWRRIHHKPEAQQSR